jgi:hypothetical protein
MSAVGWLWRAITVGAANVKQAMSSGSFARTAARKSLV